MRARWRFAAAAALVALAVCAGAEDKTVRIALTKKMFWLEAAQDALPQAQLVGEKVGQNIHRTVVVEEAVGGDLASLADALTSGDYDFVVSDGLDFVRLQQELVRRAKLTGTQPGTLRALAGVCMPPDAEETSAGTTCALVVTGNDPGLRTMADLRGKRLVYGPLSENDCSMLFLEGLLRKEGVRSKEEFFGSVKRLSCEDACFIALLRGSADVTCIGEEKLFAKAMVTGPVTNNLRRLASSKPYVATIFFCLEGKADAKLADDVRAQLMVLHQSPEGRKLLEMFHVRHFVPVSAESITTIEDLIQAAQAAPAPPRGEGAVQPRGSAAAG